jgi:hypothetical protein
MSTRTSRPPRRRATQAVASIGDRQPMAGFLIIVLLASALAAACSDSDSESERLKRCSLALETPLGPMHLVEPIIDERCRDRDRSLEAEEVEEVEEATARKIGVTIECTDIAAHAKILIHGHRVLAPRRTERQLVTYTFTAPKDHIFRIATIHVEPFLNAAEKQALSAVAREWEWSTPPWGSRHRLAGRYVVSVRLQPRIRAGVRADPVPEKEDTEAVLFFRRCE